MDVFLCHFSEQLQGLEYFVHYPTGHYVVILFAAKGVQISMTEEIRPEHVFAYTMQFFLSCESKSRRSLPPLECHFDVLLDGLRHLEQVLAYLISVMIEEYRRDRGLVLILVDSIGHAMELEELLDRLSGRGLDVFVELEEFGVAGGNIEGAPRVLLFINVVYLLIRHDYIQIKSWLMY